MTDLVNLIFGVMASLLKLRAKRGGKSGLAAADQCASTMGAEKAAPEKYRSISVRLALPWCPFRKFHPAQVRIVRQNHRIIESDVYNPARARNVCSRPVQVAEPAENLFLRHQLTIALLRAQPRLRLRGSDRALLIWITRLWPSLVGAAQVVQPETILRCIALASKLSGAGNLESGQSGRRSIVVPSENVIRKSIRTISGSNSLFLRKNSLFRCVIEADARRYHGNAPNEIDWSMPERQTRAAAEFLVGLDDEDPDANRTLPKMVSPVDPCSAWTAKANKRVQFCYGLNYLIDIENAFIVDVEATPAKTYDEVADAQPVHLASRRAIGWFGADDRAADHRGPTES